MSESAIDIAYLFSELESMRDADGLIIKNTSSGQSLEAAGIISKISGNATEAANAVIQFISDVVSQDAGSSAGDKAEKQLRECLETSKTITVGHCKEVLRQFAVKSNTANSLKDFLEKMPAETLKSLRFDTMSPYMQVAIMSGVQKGVEMMEAITALPEEDNGALAPQQNTITLDAVRKAQKVLAKGIKGWAGAVREALPDHNREKELPAAMEIIIRLLITTKVKLLRTFLDTMTVGTVADIFAVQKIGVRALSKFAEEVNLPNGINATEPKDLVHMLHMLLMEAACQRIRVQRGISKPEMIKNEAKDLLLIEPRKAMARLLRLHLNELLSDLPSSQALKPRANVKGFTGDGFHADFVRDCIAKRFAFTLEGHGQLANAVDREQLVSRGKSDLEFYEKKMEELALEEKKEGEDPEKWERPVVRSSASLTQEDLADALNLAMLAIPDVGMRMAITAIANQASMALIGEFFGKDPLMGVFLQGNSKEMSITFNNEAAKFDVSALLYHDTMKSMERHGDGEDEISLGRANFTQLEYNAVIKKDLSRGNPSAFSWTVTKVNVTVIVPNLFPPA